MRAACSGKNSKSFWSRLDRQRRSSEMPTKAEVTLLVTLWTLTGTSAELSLK